MAEPEPWQIHFVRGGYVDESGEQHDFDWKALIHRSGLGWWEFFDVLIGLQQVRPRTLLHEWWARHKGLFETSALPWGCQCIPL